MDRFPFDADDRDALIAELAEQRVRSWNRRLLAHEPRAESDLQNTVLEHLTSDEAKALFVKAAIGVAVADALFASIVNEAMYEACKAEAIRVVDSMEESRQQSADDNRIAQAELARLMH